MADFEFYREGHVATVLLNRPQRKNAFTLSMIDEWVDALVDARSDPEVRVVVLRGMGSAFCAGADLSEVSADMRSDPLSMKELLHRRVQRIPLVMQDFDKPVIASISGAAYGAGLDLALMCDMRLAAQSATFSESYIRAGFLPGEGGLYFLTRLVGVGKAFEMFLTGDTYSAEEALAMGMINHVYSDDNLLEETYSLAERLAATSPVAVSMMKRALYQSAELDLRTSLDLISSHIGVLGSTPDSGRALSSMKDRLGRHLDEAEN